MKNYISIDKKPKKERKAYYSEFRKTWYGLNPMTRTVPNGKAYRRSKNKREGREISREYAGRAFC